MIALQEIVIASNERTKYIHKELFRFADESYILIDSLIRFDPSAIRLQLCENAERVHLALNWTDMIRFGTGREKPATGDILILLKKVGLSEKEIQPFRDSIYDILAYLYYGKRFDILRRLCSVIKQNLERDIKGSARVNCHLIYEETGSIIASSL
ncbi:MAG: hypothetical protein ACK415_01790 [Thermodesulfovibrionales bacterium]